MASFENIAWIYCNLFRVVWRSIQCC